MGAGSPLVFAGGVAKNPAMVALVREGFGGEVLVPGESGTDSQIIGAYGAALCAPPEEVALMGDMSPMEGFASDFGAKRHAR